MSATAGAVTRPGRAAEQVSLAALLLLPLALLHARAAAELLIGVIDALFLLRCASAGAWSWLRQGWALSFIAWWSWTALCSLPIAGLGGGWPALAQALASGRLLLLAAAAEWLLAAPARRGALAFVLAAAAAWIALQCWQQYLLGHDLFGWPRWGDGALTGPFRQPRAGPALVLLLFPAILPATGTLLRRPGRIAAAEAAALVLFAVATMVLIGQRMPVLLTGIGLIACGVLLPRTRPAVLAAAIGAALLLAALPIVSPPTFGKLVLRFTAQITHFGASAYGQIYHRAAAMALAHPLFGLGFDGFRHHCNDPAYRQGPLTAADAACSIHPHNHYLEAATAGGLPGLLLFCATVLSWLATLGRGLLATPAPRRAALFIALLLATWPLASTSAFFTLPNAGWCFLLLGAGLAERHPLRRSADQDGAEIVDVGQRRPGSHQIADRIEERRAAMRLEQRHRI